jgi:GDP-4-dehydro-6-deoxy-D-mannose reductase
MERVIVTGVSGFVGHHLTDKLIASGFEVIGASREEHPSVQLQAKLGEYIQCDLTDYDSVQKLPLAHAKAVINLAGLAAVGPSFDNPELYMHVNTAVIDTICRAAIDQRAKDLRILAISSGAIYASGQPLPLTEHSRLDSKSSPYAKSKIAMEELALQYREQGIDCIVARPFNHIGPGQLKGFLLPDLYAKIISTQADNSELLVGNLTTKRDYTDVRDVAQAYIDLITSPELQQDIYNVCTGKSVSGEEILKYLLEEMDIAKLSPKVDQKLFRPSDSPELYGDSSSLRSDTSWETTFTLQDTIRDFVTWARTH